MFIENIKKLLPTFLFIALTLVVYQVISLIRPALPIHLFQSINFSTESNFFSFLEQILGTQKEKEFLYYFLLYLFKTLGFNGLQASYLISSVVFSSILFIVSSFSKRLLQNKLITVTGISIAFLFLFPSITYLILSGDNNIIGYPGYILYFFIVSSFISKDDKSNNYSPYFIASVIYFSIFGSILNSHLIGVNIALYFIIKNPEKKEIIKKSCLLLIPIISLTIRTISITSKHLSLNPILIKEVNASNIISMMTFFPQMGLNKGFSFVPRDVTFGLSNFLILSLITFFISYLIYQMTKYKKVGPLLSLIFIFTSTCHFLIYDSSFIERFDYLYISLLLAVLLTLKNSPRVLKVIPYLSIVFAMIFFINLFRNMDYHDKKRTLVNTIERNEKLIRKSLLENKNIVLAIDYIQVHKEVSLIFESYREKVFYQTEYGPIKSYDFYTKLLEIPEFSHLMLYETDDPMTQYKFYQVAHREMAQTEEKTESYKFINLK